MSIVRTRRWRPLLTLLFLFLGLVVVACAQGPDSGAGTQSPQGAPGETGPTGEGEQAAGSGQTVKIGYIVWAEDIAVTYLWEALLQERGYDVELVQLEAAPAFAGLASGSIDLFLDAWLPSTHATYWEQFGDQLEDLGTWYDQADLGLAVPNYVEAQSIADLPAYAEQFGRRIVGIDPGAGLMRITRESAMPGYGLDDWQLLEGSETSMLAALDEATRRQEWIVVTLWRPHWAFAVYDIRYLEDPKGLMNPTGSEQIHALGRQGFSEDFPDLARWLGNFEMSLEELAALEAAINEADDERAGVQAWLQENRDVVERWFE